MSEQPHNVYEQRDAILFRMSEQLGALTQATTDAKDSRTHMRREIGELGDAVRLVAKSVTELAAQVTVQAGVDIEINSTLDDIEPRVEALEKAEKGRFKSAVKINGIIGGGMLGLGMVMNKADSVLAYLQTVLKIGGKS